MAASCYTLSTPAARPRPIHHMPDLTHLLRVHVHGRIRVSPGLHSLVLHSLGPREWALREGYGLRALAESGYPPAWWLSHAVV